MKKGLAFCVLFLSIAVVSSAQSKKNLRTYGIIKKTETIVKYKDDLPGPSYISDVEKYNKQGEWIERIKYDKDGSIRKREVRIYKKGLIVEEIKDEPQEKEWTEKTPAYKHRTYTFDKEDLLEEKKLNRKGELKEKTVFKYNKYGDVIFETTTDKNGDLVELVIYTYDNRGFKKNRKTENADGKLIEIKTYDYE